MFVLMVMAMSSTSNVSLFVHEENVLNVSIGDFHHKILILFKELIYCADKYNTFINNWRRLKMIGSVSSGDAPGLLTSMMNKKTTDEQISVEILKKGLDAQKAQGEANLKLIESAAPGRIDVRV